MIVALIKLLQWILGAAFRLPSAAAVYLMRFFAEATYRAARLTGIKKTAKRNFKLLLPDSDTDSLSDKLLRNTSYSIFEFLCIPLFRESHLERISRLSGTENIDLALSKRKGVILLTMHTGNYELVPTLLAFRGYHLSSIIKATDDPLFKLINRIRSHKGVRQINVAEENMYREALGALSRNRLIGILIDTGALEGRHELISFLGKKLPVATGWITLAQRSGAPVIPCFSKREGKTLIVTFGEPMNIYRDNKREVMETIRKYYDNFIRNNPEQWAIFLNEYETKRMVEGK